MAGKVGRPRKPVGSLSKWGKWKRASRDHGTSGSSTKPAKVKKCSRCGSTKNVQVHHVNENKGDNRPQNRLLLCLSCHNKVEPKRRKG